MVLEALLLLMVLPSAVTLPTFSLTSTEGAIVVAWTGDPGSNLHNFTVSINDQPMKYGNISDLQQASYLSIPGLQPGVLYEVVITGISTTGQSIQVLNKAQVTKPLPPTIQPIGPASVSSDRMLISWMGASSSTQSNYKIEYQDTSVTNGSTFTDTVQASQTTYYLTGLKPGHNYTIKVYSISFTEYSTPAVIMENTVPLSPNITSLTATGTHTLFITWVAAADSFQSGFRVTYEKQGSNDPMPVSGCVSNACTINIDDSFTAGQQLNIKVSALQGKRESPPAQTLGNTKPQAVTELRLNEATRQTNSLMILWQEPPIYTTFRVKVDPDEGSGSIPSKSDQDWTYTQNNLLSGKMYTFTVYTESGQAQSEPRTLLAYTKPPMPLAVSYESGTTTTLNVKWDEPLQPGNYARYRLTIVGKGDTASIEREATQPRRATFEYLQPGSQHTISIMTVVGVDVYSDEAKTVLYVQPLPPAKLMLSGRGRDQLTVEWEVPQSSPPNEFSGFTISIRDLPGSKKEYSYPSTMEATFSNLSPGTQYTIDVRTVSGNRQSEPTTASFYTRPNPPKGLQEVSVTNTTIVVEWSKPDLVGDMSGYDSYQINITAPGAQPDVWNLGQDTRTFTFRNLQSGTEYSIRLSSSISRTLSEPVGIAVFTSPNSPRNLRIFSKTTDVLRLLWDPPFLNPGFIQQYVIRVDPLVRSTAEDVTSEEVSPDTFNYSLYSLRPGRTYDIKVTSLKNGRSSVPSTLMATMDPRHPRNLIIAYKATTSVEIRWQEPEDSLFDGFRIDVHNNGSLMSTMTVQGDVKSHNIDGLSPGQRYTVTLRALSKSEMSSAISKEFTTSPEGVATIEPISITTDAIEIRWSEPGSTGFSHYDLSISPNDGNLNLPVKIDRNTMLVYRYENLRPGVLYNISIQVIATLGATSRPFSREISTIPSKVLDLRTTPRGTSSIRVQWEVDPISTQNTFKVRYGTNQGNRLVLNIQHEEGKTDYSTDLVNLAAGHAYAISVQAMGNSQSETVFIDQTTNPEPVKGLRVVVEGPKALGVIWEVAADSLQDVFKVRYRGTHEPTEMTWRELEVREQQVSLEDLHPGEMYDIEITALSNGVPSLPKSITSNTPPLPPIMLAVDRSQLTTSSARLTWVSAEKTHISNWFLRYSHQGRSVWEEEYTLPSSVTEKTLEGLGPGQKYTVEVYGVTDNGILSQQPAVINLTIKPLLSTILTKDDTRTTNDTITIRYSPNDGDFDHYLFTINSPRHEPYQKSHDDIEREVRFSGLTAGQLYRIAVRTVSGDEGSQEGTWDFATKPNPPALNTTVQEKMIQLTISRPAGVVSYYIVDCKVVRNKEAQCIPEYNNVTASQPQVTLTYDNLTPHTLYTFSVRSLIPSGEFSKEVIRPVRTTQAPPGAVQNLLHSEEKPYGMLLTWDQPTETNGEIKNYIIRYTGTKRGRVPDESGDITVNNTADSYRLTELKAGYNYTISVVAVTVGEGSSSYLIVTTPILAPSLKALPIERLRPKRLNHTIEYNEFSVQLVDPFTDINGEVINYTVIITTNPADIRLQRRILPTWGRVEGNQEDGSYQAIPECADLFTKGNECEFSFGARRKRAVDDTVTFIVGRNKECKSEDIDDFCNGVVRPEKEYFVILRGYTEKGFKNSPPSEPIFTAPAPVGASGVTVLISVLVVLLFLVLFAGAAILFVLYRRGYICNKDDVDSGPRNKIMLPKMNSFSQKSLARKTFGDTSRPIKVPEFSEHFRKMSADSDFLFSEEYEDLKPVGRDQSTIAAELPCNRNKNRFTNILPYDHSRVKLLPTDDEEGTDYINANYMPGFNSKREFIVTQGPLPSTRDDFWRMVWEQNCRAIVMLTRCVEKGREKCDHYWPIDSEPMFYGDLQVLILNETKCPEWVITEFKMSKGEQSRTIKHFHYVAWPDFGVPQQPQTLIRFVRLVRGKMPADSGPVIVHCSAGVGRSGAYIAVDHLLLQLRSGRQQLVDIFALTHQMRTNRPKMVQTEQQYICIHQSLLCVLEGKENEMSPYSGEDNEGFDDSPTHNIYNTIRPPQPNDDDEGITVDPN